MFQFCSRNNEFSEFYRFCWPDLAKSFGIQDLR